MGNFGCPVYFKRGEKMESKNKLVRKEQCPSCAKNGKDTSKDNLAVYSDGQTHCFACGEHGYVTHTKTPIHMMTHGSMSIGVIITHYMIEN